MAILVTGAGGFLGVRLCQQLLQQEDTVIGLWHRDRSRILDLCDTPRFTAIQGDIRHPTQWLTALQHTSITTVFHLATQPPSSDDPARTTNVDGTRTLLEALMDVGAKRWLSTSSMSVYDFENPEYLPVDETHPTIPIQPYGEEKLAAEQVMTAGVVKGLRAISLRLSGLFGPQRLGGAVSAFARRISEGEPVEIPVNRQIDILHVDDAARALLLAHSRLDELCQPAGHLVYNIGRGEPTALASLAQEIGRVMARPVEVAAGDAGNTFYMSTAAAIRDLGFVPAPLSEGLKDTTAWLQTAAVVS